MTVGMLPHISTDVINLATSVLAFVTALIPFLALFKKT
jgi:hypothetical protein